jgi:hypothetical protein
MAKQGEWAKVDVEGRLHALTIGDRACRIEFDGSTFRASVGRRRAPEGRPRYWDWEPAGEFVDLGEAKRAAEARLPARR